MSTEEQEKFIIDYIGEHGLVDVIAQDFHEQFLKKFGGKYKETMYGAQPVYKAQRLLSRMYKEKILDRRIVGLPEHISGFSNWVYVYGLRE